MSNVYGAGPGGPFAGGGFNYGAPPQPQYTPNQLLAQQYGRDSRAFYSPFNSPYRPVGAPVAGFQPSQYGGAYGPPGMAGGGMALGGGPYQGGYRPAGQSLPMGPYGGGGMTPQPPGGGSPYGGMAPMGPGFNGFSPDAMARVQQIQQQGPQSFGPGQSYGAMGMDPYAAFRQPQQMAMQAGGGADPGALYRQYQQAGPGAAQDAIVRQMQGTDNGAAYRASMRNAGYQLNQDPGGAFSYSGGPQYGPGVMGQGGQSLAGQPVQHMGMGNNPGVAYQQGPSPVGTYSSQAQGPIGPSPMAPAQPFGPAFRNAMNQLRVQPPAPPQRLPYQPGASSFMMTGGRRRPSLGAPSAGAPAGPSAGAPAGLNAALGTQYGQTGTMATPQGRAAANQPGQTYGGQATANDMTSGAPTGLNPALGTAYGGRTVGNPYAPGGPGPLSRTRRKPVGY